MKSGYYLKPSLVVNTLSSKFLLDANNKSRTEYIPLVLSGTVLVRFKKKS